MRTQVGIIGGGPSGLILSQLLHLHGIDSVILERRTKDYVLTRIRAGVLEPGFIDLLHEAQVYERMMQQGYVHNGFDIIYEGQNHHVDLKGLTGNGVLIYGQTEITRDLYAAREKAGGIIIEQAQVDYVAEAMSDEPVIHYTKDGAQHELKCDFVVGCDGYYGASRKSIPNNKLKTFVKIYPFAWLGILSETPPISDELIYAHHNRGFALCSMRNKMLSRYYLQVPLTDTLEEWSDGRFWGELLSRLPDDVAANLVSDKSIEKSITPLHSYVCETMRYGRLFLAGDAAHIVPPTGAKGLNLAASDIFYLSRGLIDHYKNSSNTGLDAYSATALKRVWKAERFSWWMTSLLHKLPAANGENGHFTSKMQIAELDYIFESEAAIKSLAENYVGLPY